MLYVGIDVAKNKHDVAVIDDLVSSMIQPFTFTNNREGFLVLHIQLQTLIRQTNQEVKIALEDTGHYCFNLLAFLKINAYQTYSYNPILINKFAKAQSLRKTKTDKKDAMTIAKKLKSDVLEAKVEQFKADEATQELKFLTRHRTRFTKKQSDLKVQYTRILDILFPELAEIANKHNQFVYAMLKSYPTPQKIARAKETSLLKIPRLSASRVADIREAAKQTIGISSFALEMELVQTIQMIEAYEKQIQLVDKEINRLMVNLDSPITTITGIGERLGSVILAEIGNIHDFDKPSKLQAYAGLEPSIYESGSIDKTGKMVKRGSSHLRWALLETARIAAIHSPVFREYMRKKQAEGKNFRVALSHVAKKIIRVLYHLLKTNQPFDEKLLV